jgi:transcriptional regulator with XRE-family HTH domain
MLNQKLIEIGNRISKKRKQLNLTQEVLAEKMNVSVQMISNLERGNKSIKIENLLKLCEILNVSTDYILKGELIDSDKEEAFTKLLKLNKQDYKMIEMLIDFCINKENDGSE